MQQLNNLTVPSYYSSASLFWLLCSTSLFCFLSLPFREEKRQLQNMQKLMKPICGILSLFHVYKRIRFC